MTITIRPATLADVPRITKLVNEAYRGESGKRGWTTESDLLGGVRTDEQRVADQIETEGSLILLGLDSRGELHGCVYLEKKDGGVAYLGMLTVQVDAQARGWGSRMMSEAETFVSREWGSTRMEMTVITRRHELISWYERRGYHQSGETRPFPTDPRFGIPLKGDLEFVVLEKSLRSV